MKRTTFRDYRTADCGDWLLTVYLARENSSGFSWKGKLYEHHDRSKDKGTTPLPPPPQKKKKDEIKKKHIKKK